ncbi:MAG: VOC family protein [Clostridia bacterium]|nr:VOC family protein [Clostridia bacterium]MBQ3957013.1 VOC family protein [Clostridia bacterium]
MANEIIKGMGFHHSALKVRDLDEAIAFYEKLGMKFYTSWGEGNGRIAMMDFGDGGILELFAGGNDNETVDAKYIHLALRVDDVDEAYGIALKAGAKPKSEPRVVPLDSKPVKLTLNCGFVFGPSGEEVEFFRVVSAE